MPSLVRFNSRNEKTVFLLTAVCVAMLGLGFASKPLYDTFCKVTGYGGTPRIADENLSNVIDRTMIVNFDANVAAGLAWKFKPDVGSVTVQIGQSTLAYYNAENKSQHPIVGTATFNVTPIKAAPYFIKTECFCFTEQRLEPGQTLPFPVLFHVDPLISEDRRLDEVKEITLSYTFFEVENPTMGAADSLSGPPGTEPGSASVSRAPEG